MTIKNATDLKAEADANLADNTTGNIDAADNRNLHKNQSESAFNRLDDVGRQTVGVDASGLTPTTTAGCDAAVLAETTTNDVPYHYCAFDPTTEEHAFFRMPVPGSSDEGTLKARIEWTHPATTVNFGVVWGVKILAHGDDDAMDQAFGTEITVTDTGGTTEDNYKTAVTAAITPSNTMAKGDHLTVMVSRKAADGSDTLAVDAHLMSVELYYDNEAIKDD